MLLNYWPFGGVLGPEMVTVHEFGHQFWYGLVANNEFEEAWLDEGFNSYSTGRVMDLGVRPRDVGRDLPGPATRRARSRSACRTRRAGSSIASASRSWTYSPGAYGFYAYTKPELTLRTLEGYLGARPWRA